jgi:hypothetical protein
MIIDMTNRMLAAGVVLASLAVPASAIADENGLLGGALAGAIGGAVVGGPVGLEVGGVGGAAIGNAVTNHAPRYHHYLRTHSRLYNQ